MGFKDLTSINVAMSGKQGWKFQIDPIALCFVYLRHDISQILIFLLQGLDPIRVMCGEACLVQDWLCNELQDGQLALRLIYLSLARHASKRDCPHRRIT